MKDTPCQMNAPARRWRARIPGSCRVLEGGEADWQGEKAANHEQDEQQPQAAVATLPAIVARLIAAVVFVVGGEVPEPIRLNRTISVMTAQNTTPFVHQQNTLLSR